MNAMDRYHLGQALARLEREDEWEPYLEANCPDPALRARLLARRRALAHTPALEQAGTLAVVLTSGHDLTGSVVADRYQILELKAVGGMGAVYRACDNRLGDIVAVKVVKIAERVWDNNEVRQRRERLLERFTREQQVQTRLNNPAIVRVRDAGRTPDNRPFFVMDWVEGQPLSEYCKGQVLSLRDRLVLFQQICQAVEYAHDHLVLHRDLKLSNVLVTKEGQPRLIDFGIAKALDEDGPGLTVGDRGLLATPEYLSPEQVKGEPASTKSDQFALGVILYHLLTGGSPYLDELARRLGAASPRESAAGPEATHTLDFNELPLEQIPAVILDTQIAAPSVAAARRGDNAPVPPAALKGDLDQIVLCAIRREPELRYASVADLRKDIDRYFGREPVVARKPTLRYTGARFVRRHRAAVGIAATVLLALGILTVVQFSANRRISEQNLLLNEQKSRAEALLNTLAETQAQRALESANPREAARLLSVLTTPEDRTVVGQILRSEVSRLAVELEPERDGRFATFDRDSDAVSTGGGTLTDDDAPPYLVRFGSDGLVAVRDGSLCLLQAAQTACRTLFRPKGRVRSPSADPTRTYLSFIDDNGWWLVSKTGETVGHLSDVYDAHWLTADRLLMNLGGISTYDLATKRKRRIYALDCADSFVIGSAGVLAGLCNGAAVLYDHRRLRIIDNQKTLDGGIASLAFSHSGRQIAVLRTDGAVQMYLMVPAADSMEWSIQPMAKSEGSAIDTKTRRKLVLSFSRDDSMLLVPGRPARLLASSSLKTLDRFELSGRGNVNAFFFGATDKFGLMGWGGGFNEVLQLSKTGVGSRLTFRTNAEHGTFSADGTRLFLAGRRGVQALNLDGSVARTFDDATDDPYSDVVQGPGTLDVLIVRGNEIARWGIADAAPKWRYSVRGPAFGAVEDSNREARFTTSQTWNQGGQYVLESSLEDVQWTVPARIGPVWSPDGRWIAIKAGDELCLLDAETGKEVATRPQMGGYRTVRFSEDSKEVRLGYVSPRTSAGAGGVGVMEDRVSLDDFSRALVSTELWNNITLLSVEQGRRLRGAFRMMRGNLDPLSLPMASATNGCLAADGQPDGSVAVADAQSGRHLLDLSGFGGMPTTVALHPGSRFVLVIAAHEATVWNLGVAPGTTACRKSQ